MNFKVTTAFNEKLFKQNGYKLLDSFKNNWQPDFEFHCYYYDMDIDNYDVPKQKNIFYHNLEDVEEYSNFIRENKEHNGTEGGAINYSEALDGMFAAPKAFAISECAFNNSNAWLLWLEPLTLITKDIRTETLERYIKKDCDFMCMEDADYFAAFNLSKQTTVDLLGDLRGAYVSGEYLNYREWTTTFILSRLLTIYNAHGFNLHSSNSFKSLFINLADKSSANFRDSQGNRIVSLSETDTTPDILPNRYKQLADLIRHYKPETILETGTWNGGRAIEMALAAFDNRDAVHYIGYDLFEDATAELDAEENNVKPHNTKAAVVKRFEEFKEYMKKEKNKTFSYEIHKGNVRDTLEKRNEPFVADLAFIGSGNSEATVQHEYNCLKNTPVVIMDHFFTKERDETDNPDPDAIVIPDEKHQGVKKVFDAIPIKKVNAEKTTEDGWTEFDESVPTRKHVLPSTDKVLPAGHTHLAVILHDATLEEVP